MSYPEKVLSLRFPVNEDKRDDKYLGVTAETNVIPNAGEKPYPPLIHLLGNRDINQLAAMKRQHP